MAEPIFFEPNVEGLFVKTLGPQLDRATRERLRRIGLDLDKPLLPAYPLAVWEQALALCAESIYPGRPIADAYFQVGRRFLGGFRQTSLGAATMALSQVLGVERTLTRMNRNIRSANNFMSSEAVVVGPGRAEIHTQPLPAFAGRLPPMPEGQAHYFRGLFTEVLGLLGSGGGGSVVLVEDHPERRESRYLASWPVVEAQASTR